MPKKSTGRSQKQLVAENADLRVRLEEAEEALRAIRAGEVDALVVSGTGGERVFTLRGADHTYKTLVEEMNEGAFTSTIEGVILYTNSRLADMLKAPLQSVIGSAIDNWIVPENRNVIRKLMQQSANEKCRAELLLVANDGSRVPVMLSVNRASIDGPAPLFFLVATDLTERKAAEEALQIENERFLAFANSNIFGFFIGDWNGQVRMANDYYLNLLGATREGLVSGNVNWIKSTPPDWLPATEKAMGELRKQGFCEPFEKQYLRIDGTRVWVYVANTLLPGPEELVAAIILDITERKHAEHELQNQFDRLESLRNIDIAIGGSVDLRVTLKVILEQLAKQLHVHAADILLLNPHSLMLTYGADKGFHSNAAERTQLRLGDLFAGRVALEQKMISILDTSLVQVPPKYAEMLRAEGFVSYIGVPLVAKGQVKGVLEILHRDVLQPDKAWFDFLEAFAGQAAIALDNAELFDNLERTNAQLAVAYDATIDGWSSALDLRDKETQGHSHRVAELTLRLARELGVSDADLAHIRRGALLHDIGKMGVPDAILQKPGPLSDDEWTIMRKHPTYAYQFLSHIKFLTSALDIPYCHHEKWDGSGYPRGIKGEQIPLAARVFSVVDVWDAMNSMRPYRNAWPRDKVLEHIRSLSGTHFDPKVVNAFLRVITQTSEISS